MPATSKSKSVAYKVRLNSVSKIEDLLQETYDYSHKLIYEIQLEMNKLTQSTDLSQASPDEKAKYTKAMHDFIADKKNAIQMKMDIAKFMGDVLKYRGDANAAVGEMKDNSTSINLSALREIIANSNDNGPKTEELSLGYENSLKKQ